jgi:hypothetical protein
MCQRDTGSTYLATQTTCLNAKHISFKLAAPHHRSTLTSSSHSHNILMSSCSYEECCPYFVTKQHEENSTHLRNSQSSLPCVAELACLSPVRVTLASMSASASSGASSMSDHQFLLDICLRECERTPLGTLVILRPAALSRIPAIFTPVKKSPAPIIVMQKVIKLTTIDTAVATTSLVFLLCASALLTADRCGLRSSDSKLPIVAPTTPSSMHIAIACRASMTLQRGKRLSGEVSICSQTCGSSLCCAVLCDS